MRKNIIIMVIVLLFVSCASFKDKLTKTGDMDNAIQNAILDFSNTSGLYKKDSVFSVQPHDILYRMVLKKVDDRNSKWVEGQSYDGIMAVSISASYNKLLLTKDTKIGSIGKLPSRYLEKEGKLFYWWDDDYALTQEALDVFGRYGLLQDDEGGWVKFPDFTTNDAQKGGHYYFCKDNLTQYKKIITNKGIGFYDAPSINCGSE